MTRDNPFCVKLFKRILDIDLIHAGHIYREPVGRHIVGTEPYAWLLVQEKPGANGLILIIFELCPELKRIWQSRHRPSIYEPDQGPTVYDRTIIAPELQGTWPQQPREGSSEKSEDQGLSRDVACTQSNYEVEIVLRRQCTDGHRLEDVKTSA